MVKAQGLWCPGLRSAGLQRCVTTGALTLWRRSVARNAGTLPVAKHGQDGRATVITQTLKPGRCRPGGRRDVVFFGGCTGSRAMPSGLTIADHRQVWRSPSPALSEEPHKAYLEVGVLSTIMAVKLRDRSVRGCFSPGGESNAPRDLETRCMVCHG